jgi:hypothetical protein
MTDPHNSRLRRDLVSIEAYLERLQTQVRAVEGARDGIIAELLDLEGCHDRRPVGLR